MAISLYQQHVERWHDCTKCELHKTRKSVVLARGSVPCDVLFVGEGPGESEDVLGSPFVGPAGKLLDGIVERALSSIPLCGICGSIRVKSDPGWVCGNGHEGSDSWGRDVLTAFTNLIACIPRDPALGGKASEPPLESIKACRPRLQEFISLARPKLVVAVGTVSRDWFDAKQHPKYRIDLPPGLPVIDIHHPAFILRANYAQRSLLVQRCVVQVANAVEKYLGSAAGA